MFQWVPFVFVRIALFFTVGILLGIYQPDLVTGQLAGSLLAIVLSMYVINFILYRLAIISIKPGWWVMPFLVLAGYTGTYFSTDSNRSDHLLYVTEPVLNYQITMTDAAAEKRNTWKQEGKINAVRTANGWQPAYGKVLLYFSKKDFAEPFHYGDQLLIKGTPNIVEPPANPGEFDYKRFLSYKSIYHQHFLRDNDVRHVGNEVPSRVMHYAFVARDYSERVLHKYVHGSAERGIASALILGVTDGLDNELTTAYAASGAMHVLAVSGLHVSIIYSLLLIVLRPLKKHSQGEWAVAWISILLLWCYAFITGLSPSVLRAVTMFSFVALAKPWNKTSNVYNTLAASVFCLLLYNPYMIMSVGFQLSYLAVLGIVYLQGPLYNLWTPGSWLSDQIWKITCVSIAAQLATFALGLLYFHQFPNYFLFSNLFVIPLSFVVLVAGLGVVMFDIVPYVGKIIGFVFDLSIQVMNWAVVKIEQMPFSIIEGVYITTFQCWLLIVVVICIILLFEQRKFVYIGVASMLIILFSLIQWRHYINTNDPVLVVYRVAGSSAFDIITCNHAYFSTDTVLMKDQERIRFHVLPNRIMRSVGQVINIDNIPSKKMEGITLYRWNGITLLHVFSKPKDFPNLPIDYVLVSNNAIDKPIPGLNPQWYILDSSNTFYLNRKFKSASGSDSLRIFSVLEEGAFIKDLKKL